MARSIPNNQEAEQALLSTMFLSKYALNKAIDTIDEEHKKIHLIQYDKNDKDTSISIDFDECVYDSVTDGSSIQKAWKLAGVHAINVIDIKFE